MTSYDKLADYDISRIKLLTDFSYDDALIGVTEDNRAVLMVTPIKASS